MVERGGESHKDDTAPLTRALARQRLLARLRAFTPGGRDRETAVRHPPETRG